MRALRAAFPLVFGLILCSCANGTATPTNTPRESASATATATSSEIGDETPEPSASPEGGPTDPPPLFQNIGLAVVNVDGLAVRTEPSTSAPLLTEGQADVRLDSGDHVLVLGGRVGADSYWWFIVGLARDGRFEPPVGWIAVGTLDDPWITADNSICRNAPSFETLVSLSGIGRLACYGSAPLQFVAHQAALAPDAGLGGVCDTSVPAGFLRCDNINYNWVNADGGTDWQFLLHLDPARGIPEIDLAPAGTTGPAYAITGHFDDPAATDCVEADESSAEALREWLACAALFVVEALEPVP